MKLPSHTLIKNIENSTKAKKQLVDDLESLHCFDSAVKHVVQCHLKKIFLSR